MSGHGSSIRTLACAALVGGLIGAGSVATAPGGRKTIVDGTRRIAVATGLRRLRPPQPGDRWGGCDDARAAGTAPIYRGEPGYRSGMDGDGDGIACEPRR